MVSRKYSVTGLSLNSEPEGLAVEHQRDGRLLVTDTLERKRLEFQISEASRISELDNSPILFPVDRTLTFQSEFFTIPTGGDIFVRDGAGELIADPDYGDELEFDNGRYILDYVSPIKTYIEFQGAFNIEITADQIHCAFDEVTAVYLGCRSLHERPAGTITTTESPDDLMKAISAFGSALKTTSPERSYPNLRGHPPLIELGDSFECNGDFEAPCPEIQIAVRPTLSDVFTVAPLVYYLGGSMVPRPDPCVIVDEEVVHHLDQDESFSASARRLLCHIFTLDCIVRTVGLYPMRLYERERLETRLELDVEQLYRLSPPDRLRAYLEVPFDLVEDLVPEPPLTAHVADDPRSAYALPYLVNRFSTIEVHTLRDYVERYSSDESTGRSVDTSWGIDVDFSERIDPSVNPTPSDLTHHFWVGPGYIPGCTNVLDSGFKHALEREPRPDPISITVACNEPAFLREFDSLRSVYGDSTASDIDVTLEKHLTREKLANRLREPTDFFHLIGHVEEDGFACSDGFLHLDELPPVGVSTFLLNACNSYALGTALVERGAAAGIVTLADVMDQSAAWLGKAIGQLLNHGFPLQVALGIVHSDSITSEEYLVIGDGRLSVAQSRSTSSIIHLNTSGADLEFLLHEVATDDTDLGTQSTPYALPEERYSLVSKQKDWFNPTQDEVLEFLSLQPVPVRLNGELRWSTEITAL